MVAKHCIIPFMWLPYAPNSSWPSYDCITIAARTNYTRLKREQPAKTTPPQCRFPGLLLDVTKEKILTTLLWLDGGKVSHAFEVRLWRRCLPMHSSVGPSLNINTAGSFRKITFSRQDWTMVNMSYHQFLLKYPHSISRQLRRRANKRKRVSGACCWMCWLTLGCFSVLTRSKGGYWTWKWPGVSYWKEKNVCMFLAEIPEPLLE